MPGYVGPPLPGVELVRQPLRDYVYGDMAAQLLGRIGEIGVQELAMPEYADYRSGETIGKTGLEKYYEEQLHGTVGVQRVEMDASGHIIRVLETQPPSSGRDIQLYFDIELQKKALEALGEHTGACAGRDCAETVVEDKYSHIVGREGRYEVEPGFEDHPVTQVSWYGAVA